MILFAILRQLKVLHKLWTKILLHSSLRVHNFNSTVSSSIEDQISIKFQTIVEQEFSSNDVFIANLSEIKSFIYFIHQKI